MAEPGESESKLKEITMEKFFYPESVVVIGVSNRPGNLVHDP